MNKQKNQSICVYLFPWPGLFPQEPLPTAQGQPGELQVKCIMGSSAPGCTMVPLGTSQPIKQEPAASQTTSDLVTSSKLET